MSHSELWSNDDLNYNGALERALDELARFYIPRECLAIQDLLLGHGGFSFVYLAKLRPVTSVPLLRSVSERVAVKELRRDRTPDGPVKQAVRLAREIIVWSSCKHENILEFRGFYLSRDYQTAYLISPYMRNGDARGYLQKTLPTNETRFRLVCDTLKGLNYLHNRNPPVIHGDLKALNVLINDRGQAVLFDFDLAEINQGQPTGWTSPIRWSSPELLVNQRITLKSDIWAWGCLALEIMTGNYPFCEIKYDTDVVFSINTGRTPEPIPSPQNWPNGLLQVVRKCWEYEPGARPNVTTLLTDLNVASA